MRLRPSSRSPLAGGVVVLVIATVGAVVSAGALAAAGSGGIGAGGTAGGGVAGEDGIFPVRAKHSYGDGLGAGRDHQGQDLLAKCGKPVVAAQPGRVALNKYQAGGAGNYVVIDGAGKRKDAVYMHLQRRSALRKGQRVAAGDPVGLVGDTGRTTACHLHFELWSDPGWYEGGSPVDPAPSLRRWDRGH